MISKICLITDQLVSLIASTNLLQDSLQIELHKHWTRTENQPHEQTGFRRGYSTRDHLHTVNQIIEKADEYKTPLVMEFVDYRKTFDSVETAAVRSTLQNQGVQQCM